MTYTNTPTAVSIFAKGKSSTQISSLVQNGSGQASLRQFMDTNDTLDQLTQDENSLNSTQSSDEDSVNKSHSDDSPPDKFKSNKEKTTDSVVTPNKPNANQDNANLARVPAILHRSNTAPVITHQNKKLAKPANYVSGKSASQKIYSSPFFSEDFKPSTEDLTLTAEQELLRPLILSQLEVLTEPIKELGNISLILTKIIEKKKESFNLLKNRNRIPRSLRLKCELTTSESYTENEDFLQAKAELQGIVADFIKKGTNVITSWAEKNINLLIMDRCNSILIKALQMLDDLSSFFLETIGTPHFLSLPSIKCINLFLFKLYFSNEYIDINQVIEYFGLPRETILTIGAKIITKTDSDDEVNSMLRAVKLSDIDPDNNIHDLFLSETLTCFHQILSITTIDTWEAHKEKDRLATAALNLKAKRKSLDATNITASTANAIAKAHDTISNTQSQNLNSSLRITNLEKSFKKQEHKTNEALNSLRNFTQQKNLKGSSMTGSGTSPERKTLFQNKNKSRTQNKRKNATSQKVIDLSKEDVQESEASPFRSSNLFSNLITASNRQKNRKISTSNEVARHGKTVCWSDMELASLNPRNLDSTPFHTQQPPLPNMQNGTAVGTPYFPPTPLPYHPATFTHMPYTQHAQSLFQSPASTLNQPAFNPAYPIQWHPPQWNIPHAIPQAIPFTNPNLQKHNTTKENPFGGQRL